MICLASPTSTAGSARPPSARAWSGSTGSTRSVTRQPRLPVLAGISIAKVARLLGHADPSFTLRTYIHVLPSNLPDGDELAAAVTSD